MRLLICGGDVTLNGGDVTSKRDEGTSLWLSSSDGDSQKHFINRVNTVQAATVRTSQ